MQGLVTANWGKLHNLLGIGRFVFRSGALQKLGMAQTRSEPAGEDSSK